MTGRDVLQLITVGNIVLNCCELADAVPKNTFPILISRGKNGKESFTIVDLCKDVKRSKINENVLAPTIEC